jgi:hypothetical protein
VVVLTLVVAPVADPESLPPVEPQANATAIEKSESKVTVMRMRKD